MKRAVDAGTVLRREIAVGLFMIAALACAAWLATRAGQLPFADAGRYTLSARFTSVSGLREGAAVEMAGVRVGSVRAIRFDPRHFEAVVELSLDRAVQLRSDAIASIRTAGIVGDRFVKISQGGAEQVLAPGEEIDSTEPAILIEELIAKYVFDQPPP
ncbi:MAG: outer membrane lipid asymmetry maintenance protein MlaD [Gammaproteobacteria bacterium]